MRIRIVLGFFWMASLVCSIAVTAHAQRGASPVVRGEVVSGADVGFRIDHYNGETPVGELVVKHDGKWVAVQFGASARPAR